MRTCLFFGLLLSTFMVWGQREAANWYFGTFAGLDFNSGVPQFLLDGQIKTVEGCESFSDPDGNLLFYTEGHSVWNRNHQIMANGTGLKGSFSTTQSALAVPNPDNNGIYYIFTPDDVLAYRQGTSNGFNYSVIDINANNGQGAVIEKNTDLLEMGSEKVSAVLGADGDFYWVVTHYRDSFYSFRVDAGGVHDTPVVSRIGPEISDFENLRGALKISPNGQKLAVAHTVILPEYGSSLHLYDFDTQTGLVSNPLDLSGEFLYYGVEFSSNSTKLYGSGRPIMESDDGLVPGLVHLLQFDLESPQIKDSRYQLAKFPIAIGTEVSGSLQIGIDKKIYHSIPNDKLSVIRTPNSAGFEADFRMFAVDLGGQTATYGLPPFIQSLFESIVEVSQVCFGDTTLFETSSEVPIQWIQWDFGDPASGSDNFSNQMNPAHIFSAPGVYTVELEVQFENNLIRNFIEFVEIAEIPNVTSSIELYQCDTDGVDDGLSLFNLNEAIELFNNGNPDITAVFFDSMADAMANTNPLDPSAYPNNSNGQRIYARAFENSDCFSLVEIDLWVNPASNLGDLDPLPLCIEESLVLATWVEIDPVRVYLESFMADDASIGLFATAEDALLEQNPILDERIVFGPTNERALYVRMEEGSSCSGIGRLPLDFIIKPDFEERKTANLCGGTVTLEAEQGFESYLWSTGDDGPLFTATATGEYWVSFYSGPCEYRQTFIVEEDRTLELEGIVVRDFSADNRVTVHMADTDQEYRFSIDNGDSFQEEPVFYGLVPGLYRILISNDCAEIEEEVIVGGMDAFFTPNSDGINDYWTLYNASYFPKYRLYIFDRYGTLIGSFDDSGPGWDGTFQSRPMPSDDYWYSLQFETGRVIQGHFSLKR